jgi:hypothetical protein
MMIRLIVAGSRTWGDRERLEHCLDVLTSNLDRGRLEVVSGCARGPDTMGAGWARRRGVAVKEMPADWDAEGKAAGFRRNTRMAEYAKDGERSLLVAFWDGQSRGTRHVLAEAERLGLEVRVVTAD